MNVVTNMPSLVQFEKPFGHDLKSSVELHKKLEPNWKESEIFRIDHYLGKEMVKNIMTLRFGNPMFGALWDCNHIDNVQVCLIAAIAVCGSAHATVDINDRRYWYRRPRGVFRRCGHHPRRYAKP